MGAFMPAGCCDIIVCWFLLQILWVATGKSYWYWNWFIRCLFCRDRNCWYSKERAEQAQAYSVEVVCTSEFWCPWLVRLRSSPTGQRTPQMWAPHSLRGRWLTLKCTDQSRYKMQKKLPITAKNCRVMGKMSSLQHEEGLSSEVHYKTSKRYSWVHHTRFVGLTRFQSHYSGSI